VRPAARAERAMMTRAVGMLLTIVAARAVQLERLAPATPVSAAPRFDRPRAER
jgi:hypothetical protein